MDFKNDAATYQTTVNGIYQKYEYVNGKMSWINSDRGLWFSSASNDWMFGYLDSIGETIAMIASNADNASMSCPSDVPLDLWKYYNWESAIWMEIDSQDVHVQCLTGMEVKKHKIFNNLCGIQSNVLPVQWKLSSTSTRVFMKQLLKIDKKVLNNRRKSF